MDSLPSVSVVVCTYNRKGSILECLDSLIMQSYPGIEIIIVNDGSTDGTLGVLHEYSKNHKNVNIISQNNKGPGAARNLGINSSKGDIICFTDDDCVTDSNWISSLISGFEDNVIGVGGDIISYNPKNIFERFFEKNKLLDQKHFSKLFLITANAAYRRKTLQELEGFDTNFIKPAGEDVDLGIRVGLTGGNLKFMSQAQVLHKHRSNLMSLMKQSYGYGRGYAVLHKKYPRYFNIIPRISYFLRKIILKFILFSFRPLKMFKSNDKFLCLVEPLIDMIIFSSELSGLLYETIWGGEFSGEVNNLKINSIENSEISNRWGI